MDLTKVKGFEDVLEAAKPWTAKDHLFMKEKVSSKGLSLIENSPTMKLSIHNILKGAGTDEQKLQSALDLCAAEWGSFYYPQVKELPWNVHRSLDALAAQVGEAAFAAYTKRVTLVDASKNVHAAQEELHKAGKLFGEMDPATGRYAVKDVDLKALGFNAEEIALADQFKSKVPGEAGLGGASTDGKVYSMDRQIA